MSILRFLKYEPESKAGIAYSSTAFPTEDAVVSETLM